MSGLCERSMRLPEPDRIAVMVWGISACPYSHRQLRQAAQVLRSPPYCRGMRMPARVRPVLTSSALRQ
jgi:hypothetical protein